LKFIVPNSCKPIFSHPFKISVSLFLNSFHVWCNHSHLCGFKLLILKSMFRSLPFSICSLMVLLSNYWTSFWMHVWVGVVIWHQVFAKH
jgi:hypothetical protein